MRLFLVLLSWPWSLAFAADRPTVSPPGVDFFERKVRPLLAEHCYQCHGAKKQQAGLRLDTTAGLKQGADTGPVVIPGDPEKSLLLRAVRRESDAPMPPKEPLSAEAVAVLTEWVKSGAVVPAEESVQGSQPDPRRHWAFQPISDPVPPRVNGPVSNPIDQFVLARLEAVGHTLALPADRRTLLRRLSFDLIGLPPTPEELAAFEADTAPDAYPRLVERLLASPHYGERCARHWMDIARYADTKGYVFREDRNYPYAYTYRDYLIRSFNEDKPYDRFLIEQLAADRLELGADRSALAAMGFLTLGRRFLNNIHDVIDDRIDLIGRGLLGLTLACARCHDHKYDPIPSRDYYSLYGVLRSSREPENLPVIGEPPDTPEYRAFQAELAKRRQELAEMIESRRQAEVRRLQAPEVVAAYLQAFFDIRNNNWDVAKTLKERDLKSVLYMRWRNYLVEELKARPSVFAPLQALAAIADKNFPSQWETVLSSGGAAFDPEVVKVLRDAKPRTFPDAVMALARSLGTAAKGSSLAKVHQPGGPTDITPEEFERIRNRADRDAITDAQTKLDKFIASSPHAPPRAMVLEDAEPFQPYVFLRGNPSQRGPSVPRQFLEVLSGPARKPFTDGSGRLELAKAIASPQNPLTARVWVNRVWAYHFGQGLVTTPSDFGVRTPPPSHPELLDWLTRRFIDSGWSTKQLHRLIVLSRTYQQASVGPLADPDNRLLSRQNRQRLDFESLRDAMLRVSGALDPSIGGRSVDIFKAPYTKRRSVYAFIDRQNVPSPFRSFDVASPDQHVPMRYQTTVPQQALFLMNHPFVAEMAKALAARTANVSAMDDRLDALYRHALARSPRTEEREAARQFLEATEQAPGFGPWEQLAQVLLISNEFAFVD